MQQQKVRGIVISADAPPHRLNWLARGRPVNEYVLHPKAPTKKAAQ
jgi:hypothetical protein